MEIIAFCFYSNVTFYTLSQQFWNCPWALEQMSSDPDGEAVEQSSNQIHCVTKISFMQQQSCFIAISWHSCSLICLKSHIILIWTVFQFCVCLCVCRTCGLREPRTLQRTNFLASCAGLKSSQSPLWVWRACVPSKAPNQMRICRLA